MEVLAIYLIEWYSQTSNERLFFFSWINAGFFSLLNTLKFIGALNLRTLLKKTDTEHFENRCVGISQ